MVGVSLSYFHINIIIEETIVLFVSFPFSPSLSAIFQLYQAPKVLSQEWTRPYGGPAKPVNAWTQNGSLRNWRQGNNTEYLTYFFKFVSFYSYRKCLTPSNQTHHKKYHFNASTFWHCWQLTVVKIEKSIPQQSSHFVPIVFLCS